VIFSNTTTLLVVDDNSDFVNNFKKDPFIPGFFFTTPTSNLKFVPNFHKITAADGSSGMVHVLQIKDNSKITKNEVGAKERLQSITFKVVGEKKVNESGEDYSHELTIEPLDLGIEDLPAITRIIFSFHHLGPGRKRHPDMKGLEETWLYNHRILTESVGKSFSMKVNRFKIGGDMNQQLDCLSFGTVGKQGDFDLDSFREETAKDTSNNNNPNPDQSNNPLTPNRPKNNNNPSTPPKDNRGVIIGGVIILVLVIIGFLAARKRKR